MTEERVAAARASLTEFLGLETLRTKRFLDIGCGSGLFSYAAYQLGADKVVSFDQDPMSVECCEYLREKAKNPPNWRIDKGSVLDTKFLSGLGKFDIVYSWGVLHHTGKMWEAIANCASHVSDGGLFYFALYNKVGGPFGSEFWLKMKKLHNSLPKAGKAVMEYAYMVCVVAFSMLESVRAKHAQATPDRGMDWRIDVIDWMGGYPYEFASAEEVEDFMKGFPDFVLVKEKRETGLGNNWFLYKREPKRDKLIIPIQVSG